MIDTAYEHITLDQSNVPVIGKSGTKVIELILDHLTHGWSPDELHFQHPDLTLGQIYSALAYYWDHKSSMDEEIQTRLRKVTDLRKRIPVSTIQKRLGRKG